MESEIVETRFSNYPGAVMLRMNRPEKRNSLRSKDLEILGNRLGALSHDPNTKVIFLTGTGDAFTSGQDINEINAMSGSDLAALFERDIDILTRIVTMPKIVISAVNGASAGMGNHFAICSDICVVKKGVNFHFTGAAKAIPALLLGTSLLPMTVGLKRAKAIYLRGGQYPAEQALADGFCNDVIKESDWDAGLEKLAAEFTSRSSQTMAHNKFQLNQGVFQMLGSVKLSGLAGAGYLSEVSTVPTGRLK
ncbi:MAG: enoyl-CoA hydratase/isomerase family protein [Betaproteobacteria bacterium]